MAGSVFKIWIQLDEKSEHEKGEDESEVEDKNLVRFASSVPLLDRVEILLKQNKIKFINKAESENSPKERLILLQVFIPEDIIEDVLLGLQKIGVGVEKGSGVSVISTVVNYFADEENEEASRVASVDSHNNTKEDHIDKFYNSIRSRLVVAEVIKR